jgi:hypothetical protein
VTLLWRSNSAGGQSLAVMPLIHVCLYAMPSALTALCTIHPQVQAMLAEPLFQKFKVNPGMCGWVGCVREGGSTGGDQCRCRCQHAWLCDLCTGAPLHHPVTSA